MTDVTHNSRIQKTIIRLLNHYSFDSDKRPMPFVVADWIGCYPWRWILEAIIEALYQGRYKTISVEQILIIWQRRGGPLHHFNSEFERIVCGQLVDAASEISVAAVSQKDRSGNGTNATHKVLESAGARGNSAGSVSLDEVSLNGLVLPEADNESQKFDSLGSDYMGRDGRLSELLGDAPVLPEVWAMAEGSRPVTSSCKAVTSGLSNQARALKQWNPESHKLPVSIFEPLGFQNTRPSEWQQFTGTTIRHHPIHQFIPIKASPTMYNKLKAIAHSYQ